MNAPTRSTQFRPIEGAVYRFLDSVGDGSGSMNWNEDYSITPGDALFTADQDTLLYRMFITIEDTMGMTPEEYGDLGGPLTNGWRLEVIDESSIFLRDLGDILTVKTNAQIGRVCFDVDIKSWGAMPTDEVLLARWEFDGAGDPLHLPPGHSLHIRFTDDLSGLVEHYFHVQGYVVP